MVRPTAKVVTERELEVMHILWERGDSTAPDVRKELARRGRDLAYTTVATLIHVLCQKGVIKQMTNERPFLYRAMRSYEDVSRSMLSDLVERLFHGSREQLVLRLLEEKKLTAKERSLLRSLLKEEKP